MEKWTIQKLLNWTTEYFTEKGLESPRLSGELLISYVLQLSRIELYTKFDMAVSKEQLDKLHKLTKRASEGEPIQYLTGKVEFYSIELEVNKDCLIPRPETELLVEKAIEFLRSREAKQSVCDLCTGCGCIAVAIAKNCESVDIVATDISTSEVWFG
ncbi:MAG: N5-glutamine methyltransferase family protein [Planctomycetota bacterium]|jgi:release factor glutamine methyltransferase